MYMITGVDLDVSVSLLTFGKWKPYESRCTASERFHALHSAECESVSGYCEYFNHKNEENQHLVFAQVVCASFVINSEDSTRHRVYAWDIEIKTFFCGKGELDTKVPKCTCTTGSLQKTNVGIVSHRKVPSFRIAYKHILTQLDVWNKRMLAAHGRK